jgi:hypothetical protein
MFVPLPGDTKPPSDIARRELVLKEVAVQTPLAQARSIMEGHGFSCWGGVSDGTGTCLQCTAYRPKNQYVADKVQVKLYYQKDKIVNAAVLVRLNVEHSDRLLPVF